MADNFRRELFIMFGFLRNSPKLWLFLFSFLRKIRRKENININIEVGSERCYHESVRNVWFPAGKNVKTSHSVGRWSSPGCQISFTAMYALQIVQTE